MTYVSAHLISLSMSMCGQTILLLVDTSHADPMSFDGYQKSLEWSFFS